MLLLAEVYTETENSKGTTQGKYMLLSSWLLAVSEERV
jgi:hypothetical protein